MKNSLRTFLLIMLLSIVRFNTFAYDIAVKNEDGVTIYYNYINDGAELEVTNDLYSNFNDYVGNIVIPEKVTYQEKTLKVTSIGDGAFLECRSLTSITLPSSITRIGEDAFWRCWSMTSITIPNSVTSIGSKAFQNCSGLTSVNIPNSVTSIGVDAFSGCSSLTAVHITDLSAWCGINIYSYPLFYAHHLFLNGKEVKDLIIPNDVTSIGDDAFSGCSGLTSVTIPNGVTRIGERAFNGCI